MSDVEAAVEEEVVEESTLPIDEQIQALLEPEEKPLEEATPEPEVDENQEPVEDDIEGTEQEAADDKPDIDYDMEIPLGDGRDPVTLSSMKDAYQNLERVRDTLDTQRMSLLAQEQELNTFMQTTGVEIPKGFQEHMQKQQEQHLGAQHDLMMQMIPEAQDKEGFTNMRAGIAEVAKASNFTEQEIAQINDARVIHVLNRLAKLEARAKSAQETVVQLKKKPGLKGVKPKPRTKVSKLDKQVGNAMKSNNQDDKDAAIAALINS